LDVELSKEEEKGKNVDHVRCRDSNRQIVTALDDQIGPLGHHGDKLNHLHQGQVRFPPNGKTLSGSRILGVHADEIIGVHDGVNETIQDNGEVNVTIIEHIGIEPVKQEDGDVVVHVQKGKLSPLLSQHDENGIPEIPDFGNVKQPQQIGQGRILLAVSDARSQRVVVAVRQQASLDRHVGTKHNLRNIVNKFDGIRVDRWQEFHDLGADDHKQEVCQSNVEGTWKVSEPPSLRR
jgi:hypothetical protein